MAGTARGRHRHPGRAGHPVASHAAAIRAQSHQSVAARGRRRRHRGGHGRRSRRRRASCGRSSSPACSPTGRSSACSSRTSIRITWAMPSGSRARFGVELWCPQAEWLMAQLAFQGMGGNDSRSGSNHYRRHGVGEAQVEAFRDRGNHYRQLVPSVPEQFRAVREGDILTIGAATMACLHRARPRARARVSALSGCRRADLRRSGPAEDHDQRRASGRISRAPTRFDCISTRSAASVPCPRTR